MTATITETPKETATSTVPTLSLEGIEVAYDQSIILRGIDIEVPQNELVCLMGRNGVGKTTTLKTSLGLLKPRSGKIYLEGQDVTSLKPEQRARLGMASVPQGRDIFPNLTVWENLKIGIVVHGQKAKDQLDRVFELFPVLKEMLKRKGGVLSGGQQQQLAIGRALLTDPKVLVLDEPTEGIQPSIIDQIEDTLIMLKEEGRMSIFLVEQYLDFAKACSDRFYIMDRGSIVKHGVIAELDEEAIAKYLTV
ncbi:MAG: urea ABC transporter ATP-binding subunit UrtE [Verrucomicrobiales bacterium]|nr:urea ABC transporter ATP-binding subunit UrtE [Verrucomicrobiales bacterium]